VEWADPLGLARLQYIMIDNYGGSPLNSASNTLKAGVDPRLQHFAFYLTDIAGAPGKAMIYDPNGTFSSVNQNGAVGWDSLTGQNHWQSFQSHYSSSMNTGTWASVNNFDDNQAAKLFEELVGYNPVSNTPAPGTCPTPPVGLASLPDLPQGFSAIENYAFPSYVHLLTKPTFFVSDMPSENDTRYVDLATVPWGGVTFKSEGTDTPNNSYSREPHLPPSPSGITIGRGYDLGQHTAQKIRSALTRSGMSASDIALLAGAAGKKGSDAAAYMQANPALAQIRLTREQQYLLYLQTYEEQSKVAEQLYNDHVKNGGTDWDKLDPLIRDTLVDLKYRGDFHNVSATNPAAGLAAFAKDFRDAASGNSVKDMCIVMSNTHWKDARWPPGASPPPPKKVGDLVWGVPKDRFDNRINLLSSGTGICPP
jgi:hypothetical protein